MLAKVLYYNYTHFMKLILSIYCVSKYFGFVKLNVPTVGSSDGWMTCDFTSSSTVFQSYQDDGRVKMTGFMQ